MAQKKKHTQKKRSPFGKLLYFLFIVATLLLMGGVVTYNVNKIDAICAQSEERAGAILQSFDAQSNMVIATDSLGRSWIDSVNVFSPQNEALMKKLIVEQSAYEITQASQLLKEASHNLNTTLILWAALLTFLSVVFTLFGMMEIKDRLRKVDDVARRTEESSDKVEVAIERAGEVEGAVKKVAKEVLKKSEDVAKKTAYESSKMALIAKATKENSIISELQLNMQSALNHLYDDRKIAQMNDIIQAINKEGSLEKERKKQLTATCFFHKGNVYFSQKKYEEAIENYSEAVENNPLFAYAYSNRGDAYQKLKKYQKAVSDYTDAMRLNPKIAGLYFNRGAVYAVLKEYQNAVRDYTEAIRQDVQNPEIYTNRGISYQEMKEYKKAINDYNKALSLKPEAADILYNRGNTYKELKEYQKAIKDYTESIALDPTNASAYFFRGAVYADLAKYEETEADFSKAILLEPEYAEAYLGRGMVAYAELNNIANAIVDLNKAISLDTDNRKGVKSIAEGILKECEEHE